VFLVLWKRSSTRPSGATSAAYSENEGWVVARGGEVVKKEAQGGVKSLTSWEKLVYCLWVTDYMMRNAGDFENAVALYPNFQTDAKQLAKQLSLPVTYEAFSLSKRKLQRKFVDLFEAVCDEIKRAEPDAAPNGGPATPPGNSRVIEGPPWGSDR
jgi:hypothetical protein